MQRWQRRADAGGAARRCLKNHKHPSVSARRDLDRPEGVAAPTKGKAEAWNSKDDRAFAQDFPIAETSRYEFVAKRNGTFEAGKTISLRLNQSGCLLQCSP